MKAIIVSVDNNKQIDFEYYVEECENLALACELTVVGVLKQKLPKFDSKFYIGSGKIEELKLFIEDSDADLVVINDEIKSSVQRNLEKVLECEVIGRTQLILNIFAVRAKSKEAKLQVEIARLNYYKSRIVGTYSGMDRQVSGDGIVARGSGETKLETDRRVIATKIKEREKELLKFAKTRDMQRSYRMENNLPVVALVGYTNAGKSTLMNSLVENKKVFEKDMLFATLDTSVREVKLASGLKFLLVDTVGFVSNLPHQLVKAFHSTLEEITTANLIINLCDYTDVNHQMHLKVVKDTLAKLEVNDIEQLLVFNKIDLVDSYEDFEIGISAKHGTNIDKLLLKIEEVIFKDYVEVRMKLPYSETKLLNDFKEYTYVIDTLYEDDGIVFTTKLSSRDYKKYFDKVRED